MKEIKYQMKTKVNKRNRAYKIMTIAMRKSLRFYKYFMNRAKKTNSKGTSNIAKSENNSTFISNLTMKN